MSSIYVFADNFQEYLAMVHRIAVNIMHIAVMFFLPSIMFPEELFVQSVYSVKIFMMKGV